MKRRDILDLTAPQTCKNVHFYKFRLSVKCLMGNVLLLQSMFKTLEICFGMATNLRNLFSSRKCHTFLSKGFNLFTIVGALRIFQSARKPLHTSTRTYSQPPLHLPHPPPCLGRFETLPQEKVGETWPLTTVSA